MAEIEEIDLVLGNNEKNNIVSITEEYYNGKNKTKKQVTDIDHQKEFLDFGIVTYTEKTRAVIKIQDGCNNFCSYCLIPYARGRIRSRKKESVLEEIEQITKKDAPIMADTIKKESVNYKESLQTPNSNNSSTQQKTSNNTDDLIKQLRELKNLVDEGILTEEEFNAKKKQLLGL